MSEPVEIPVCDGEPTIEVGSVEFERRMNGLHRSLGDVGGALSNDIEYEMADLRRSLGWMFATIGLCIFLLGSIVMRGGKKP